MLNKLRNVDYVVRVNGELSQTFPTLKEARKFIKTNTNDLLNGDVPRLVEIVKVSTVQAVIASFIPQVVTGVTLVSTTEKTSTGFETGITEA